MQDAIDIVAGGEFGDLTEQDNKVSLYFWFPLFLRSYATFRRTYITEMVQLCCQPSGLGFMCQPFISLRGTQSQWTPATTLNQPMP